MKVSASTAVVVAAVTLALTPTAGGDHTLLEVATPGAASSHGIGGRVGLKASVSPDGTRLFFVSPDRLTAADTDDFTDVYMRSGGATTLVSTAPVAGAQNDVSTNYFFVSDDSTRAYFPTSERLVAEDTDALLDMYEWAGGTLRLIDRGSVNALLPNKDNWFQLSADGSRVFFESDEQLAPGDTDGLVDVYEHANGQTRLVSAGTASYARFPQIGSPSVSADGSQLVFETLSALVPDDADTLMDSYLWEEGTITLASTGPGDTGTQAVGDWTRMARDGTIVFDTAEPLVPGDTDTRVDVYSRVNGVTTLRSTAAPGGAANAQATRAGISEDGSHVFFHSFEALAPEDTDNHQDLYENVNGTTRLVSTGPTNVCPGGIAPCAATLETATPDGSHVVFSTGRRLVPEDTDSCLDSYERVDGAVTRLVTTGPTDAGCRDSGPPWISDDGERIVFNHDASLVPEDQDHGRCAIDDDDGGTIPVPCTDVYERHAGVTTLLSIGPIGGDGGHHAGFDGMSSDGSVIAFSTVEPLFMSDTDGSVDMHVRRLATGYPRPAGATPLRVSLVPAFDPCTSPNRAHGPPLAYPSCAPPVPRSSLLTVGVGDGDPATARSIGFVRLALMPGTPGGLDDTDVRLQASLTNVMRKADLSDYTGELRGAVELRVTDRDEPATVVDFPFRFTMPCTATTGTFDGATCRLVTTADAVTPGIAAEGRRAIFALEQVRVFDGGPDEDADTDGDNSPFAVQGVFVP